jgi:GxxExxY protein
MSEEYKYKEITGRIIGAAIEVHKTLGNGFQEVIYQRALEIEFFNWNLHFKREFVIPVSYKNHEIGSRRVDFLIEDLISVEIKAIIQLEDVHMAQAKNYLEAYDLELGLLLNFGAKSLEFKRLINTL